MLLFKVSDEESNIKQRLSELFYGEFFFLIYFRNKWSEENIRGELRHHADDVALMENSVVRAQKQLDAYKKYAVKVGLRLNIKKTEQMQLIQPKEAYITKLVIDG